jgi:hypothetical protein
MLDELRGGGKSSISGRMPVSFILMVAFLELYPTIQKKAANKISRRRGLRFDHHITDAPI